MRPIAVLLLCWLASGPVSAQSDAAVFDISIRGIRAATLSLSGTLDGRSYAAHGTLRSSGILGLLRTIRYDAAVVGHHDDSRFTPTSYREVADTGERRSAAVMHYHRGVPQVKSYKPPRPAGDLPVDPSSQGGTVDPLTALYAVMRPVPSGDMCNLKAVMFDGRRRSQIVLGAPVRDGETIRCKGEYRRLEGFSKADMAKKAHFPFVATFRPIDDGRMQVSEIAMDTLYGKGRMIRR